MLYGLVLNLRDSEFIAGIDLINIREDSDIGFTI